MTTPYELAKKELGTYEWQDGSNPKVVAYFKDSGNPGVVDDDVAWCAAFVGAMIKRAGGKGTGLLTARSYLDWGIPVEAKNIREGDILIFKRGNSAWQGHVTFAAGKPSGGKIKCLGGNQANSVNIQTYTLGSQFLGARRWPGGQKVVVTASTSKPVDDKIAADPVAKPASTPSSTPPATAPSEGFLVALIRWLVSLGRR